MKSFAQSTFDAIGTTWSIDLFENVVSDLQRKIFADIHRRIDEFDKTYSRFRQDSLVTQVANRSGTYRFPDDFRALLLLYNDLYTHTSGTFTPLIGNVLSDAGYDADYSFHKRDLTPPDPWEDVLLYDHPFLTVKKPVILDFGAAGKGYLVDIIAELLKSNGIKHFCVDAGGDLSYASNARDPLRVGLEHPANAHQVIGIAEIFNRSICGSSGNRRKWSGFHHIISPKTLTSPKNIIATWVIADTTILADALTTCLFFVSPESLAKYYDFEYVIVDSSYRIKRSMRFQGEFFTKRE